MAIEISAVTRAAKGTGASRRLRRSAKAVSYTHLTLPTILRV